MELFGPNVIVDGTTVSGPTKRPNSDADRAAYERGVMAVRDKIRQTQFGTQLLEIISNNPEPIIIAQSPSLQQAGASATKRDGSAFPAGFPITDSTGTVVGTGTGTGSMSVILFNPKGTFGGMGADVTLLHELLHSYRHTRGRWSPLPIMQFLDPAKVTNPLAERLHFENWEEWFSVVAEGIYSAEAGATSVRTTHSPLFQLNFAQKSSVGASNFFHPNAQTDSEIFADKYRLAVLRIAQQESDIYHAMRVSKAWFNPVRDWERLLFSTRH